MIKHVETPQDALNPFSAEGSNPTSTAKALIACSWVSDVALNLSFPHMAVTVKVSSGLLITDNLKPVLINTLKICCVL